MSDPVGNPEDRFSRVTAHITINISSMELLNRFVLNEGSCKIKSVIKFL